MGKSIILNFGEPEHGWLPVDLHYEEFKIEFDASDVLNDPIEELLNALLNIENGGSKQITWWLEPAAYYFYLEKDNSNYTLSILETENINNSDDKREIVKTIEGNYNQVIAPIRKSILEFSSKTYEEKHWPYSIDKNKFKKIL